MIHSSPIDVRRDRVTMNATPSATSEGRRQCGVLVAPAAEVTLTNRADLVVGGFSLQKVITGEPAGVVPAGTEFTVAFSYELDGVPATGTATVLADGTVANGPQNLPVGTVVTFGEVDLPALSGVVAGWPSPAREPWGWPRRPCCWSGEAPCSWWVRAVVGPEGLTGPAPDRPSERA